MTQTKHEPRETQPIGETALSFTARGRWGHFRRVTTTEMNHTYRVIPRTTVQGLIAALMGWERDSYYNYFTPENGAIAISPGTMLPYESQTELTTKNIAQNDIAVESGDFKSINGNDHVDSIIDPTKVQDSPKRRLYEYVRSPEYRIFLTLQDETRQNNIHEQLSQNKATYSPSLGRSECSCTIEYHGKHQITESTGNNSVNSILRVEHTDGGSDCELERTPYQMQAASGGRQATGFYQYAFSTAGPIKCTSGTTLAQCDNMTLQFQ